MRERREQTVRNSPRSLKKKLLFIRSWKRSPPSHLTRSVYRFKFKRKGKTLGSRSKGPIGNGARTLSTLLSSPSIAVLRQIQRASSPARLLHRAAADEAKSPACITKVNWSTESTFDSVAARGFPPKNRESLLRNLLRSLSLAFSREQSFLVDCISAARCIMRINASKTERRIRRANKTHSLGGLENN